MKKNRIYSFDLFETIVTRIVREPKDIFKLMIYEAAGKGISLPDNFADKRALAEKRASDNKRDYNIYDIYSAIEDIPANVEDIIEIEFATELKYATVNNEILQKIKKLSIDNVDIYIISDMYWPTEFLERYLEHFGVSGYKGIFCSCDCNAFKYNGSLFKYVLKQLKIQPGQLVHTGDNKRSDFAVPGAMGIHAHLCTKGNKYRKLYLNNRKTKKGLLDNSRFIYCLCDDSQSREYQLGYSLFGPVLFDFVRWIEAKRKKSKRTKLFFLSRDGLIVKKAYEILYPGSNSSYFYASRKALIVPTLHYYNSYEQIKECFFSSGRETTDEILNRLGVDYNSHRDLIDHCCDIDGPVSSGIGTIYNELREKININSVRQEELLLEYIASEGLDDNSVIVDIGWFGNMQYSLETIMNNNSCRLEGLYLGTVPYAKRIIDKQINAEGFLFSGKAPRYYQPVKSAISFFEFFFTAEHGTVLGYEKAEELRPILGEEELNRSTEIDERYVHSEMQRGALKYVEDRKKFHHLNNRISRDDAMANIETFLDRPMLADIRLLSDISISKSGDRVRTMIDSRSFLFYVFHIKDFINDFNQAGIKTAFFKSVFRMDIPYMKWYMFVRKILGRGNT